MHRPLRGEVQLCAERCKNCPKAWGNSGAAGSGHVRHVARAELDCLPGASPAPGTRRGVPSIPTVGRSPSRFGVKCAPLTGVLSVQEGAMT